jgi:hypothetical protein
VYTAFTAWSNACGNGLPGPVSPGTGTTVFTLSVSALFSTHTIWVLNGFKRGHYFISCGFFHNKLKEVQEMADNKLVADDLSLWRFGIIAPLLHRTDGSGPLYSKPTALLRELCEAFDIDLTGRKNMLARLQKNFQPHSDKPFPVLMVDDAHTMEKQSFLDLCSLLHDAQSRTAAAALVLAGQPALKKMLELDIFAPVRTRMACINQLSRLSIDEAKEFIAFRLQCAEADPHLFQEQAIEAIAADSNGNRRIIMNLAALCLEEAAARNEKTVSPDIVNMITIDQNQ